MILHQPPLLGLPILRFVSEYIEAHVESSLSHIYNSAYFHSHPSLRGLLHIGPKEVEPYKLLLWNWPYI